MKTCITVIVLLLFSNCARAQNGLEKIIVEKYYVSDAKDAESVGGKIPVGSVTYRVFVDMLPQYRFQAVYGIPGHAMHLTTTTKFFNNEDRGASIPTIIPDRNLIDNTVMLDSWLSVGAASEATYGVLKSDDDASNTIVNAKGYLQNEALEAGIPIKQRDGLRAGTAQRVTTFGIDSALLIFNNKSIASSFSTSNGSWASLRGSVGIDSLTNNRLLIGQFTTDGVFSFELNIQIGTPAGGVENYVAKNPGGLEILLPGLIYTSTATSTNDKLKAKNPKKK